MSSEPGDAGDAGDAALVPPQPQKLADDYLWFDDVPDFEAAMALLDEVKNRQLRFVAGGREVYVRTMGGSYWWDRRQVRVRFAEITREEYYGNAP